MAFGFACRERSLNERARKFPNAIASIRCQGTFGPLENANETLTVMKLDYPELRWITISNSIFVEYPAGYAQFRIDAVGHLLLIPSET